jgi:hypothetical protein
MHCFVCTFHPQFRLELVIVVAAPTHSVRHVDRFTVEMYIPSNVQVNLVSPDTTTRGNARKWVCVNFKKACDAEFGDKWKSVRHNSVEWHQIELTILSRKQETIARQKLVRIGECCDDDSCNPCASGDAYALHASCTATPKCTVQYVYR